MAGRFWRAFVAALKQVDLIIRSRLNRDREAGLVGSIPRTPEEMAAWHKLPDPKPDYREFVGLPEEK
jgi:hypothetical protein